MYEFQQTWGGQITELKLGDNVKDDCQENIVNILKYAINEVGVNHIETANMYGSSEIQLGDVFQKLFKSGIKREDVIIQTKVQPMAAAEFRKPLEDSFQKLRLEYVDLLSFHGLNYYKHYDEIFNNIDGENLMDIAQKYVKAGKVRNIGFLLMGNLNLLGSALRVMPFLMQTSTCTHLEVTQHRVEDSLEVISRMQD
jgi:predicted aldo/keto reductase-like oxidoreductase